MSGPFSVDVRLSAQLRSNLDQLQALGAVDVVVGTDLTDPPYPVFLEYGTSRMGARPSARPAYEQSRDAAIRLMGSVVRDQFRRGRFTPEAMIAAGLAGGEVVRNRWVELAPVRTGTYRRSIQVEADRVR